MSTVLALFCSTWPVRHGRPPDGELQVVGGLAADRFAPRTLCCLSLGTSILLNTLISTESSFSIISALWLSTG